jgi:hypothetical protein
MPIILERAVREIVFNSFDIDIFYYLRRNTKAAVVQDLFWQLTDALYETVDASCRYEVCVETSVMVQRYAEN